jgi:hypothetical protein
VREGQAGGDGDGLQAAVLLAAVAAVAWLAPTGIVFHGSFRSWVQAGPVALHDQDVVRFLAGDQVIGMLALGMQCIGGDDGSGEIQWARQRREPVISLVLPSTAVCARTARACWSMAASRCAAWPPAAECRVPRRALPSTATTRRRPPAAVALASQDVTADGRLARRPEPASQRIEADAQHARRGIGDPLADRRQRLRAG